MKNKWIAYFLWLISGFGWFGLHNFYLNRPWRGIIWIFTQGLFWFGSAYDLITIHKTVKDINDEYSYNNYIESETRTPSNSFSNNNELETDFIELKKVSEEQPNRLDLNELFKIEVSNGRRKENNEPFRISIRTNFDKLKKDSDVEYISSNDTPTFDFPKNEKADNNYTRTDNHEDYYYDRSKLYKSKLELTDLEKELIKHYRNSYRKFVEIEFCDLETLKLSLHLYHQLENLYQARNKDLEKKLNEEHKKIIADKKKEYLELYDYIPDWLESNYEYYSPKSYLLSHLQQIAENTLRLKYNYNRQVDTEYAYNYLEENFNYTKEYIDKLLEIYDYSYPDMEAEIVINEHCTARWKKEIVDYDIERYDDLVEKNVNNPSLFRLLHSCAKKCIKADKKNKGIEYMLLATVKAPKKKQRPTLTSTEIKSLFRTEKEKKKYLDFIEKLGAEIDDAEIISFAKLFYHKNIVLSQSAIDKVIEKNESLSAKVGEYLKEEEIEIDYEEKATPKDEVNSLNDIFDSGNATIEFIEKETLIINYLSDKKEMQFSELAEFAKNNSIRLKKVINSINKKSYEVYEESLITIDENIYKLNSELVKEIKC